ncbi:polyprenyl synthetase family protein [Streptomyces sp. NL15-2K]|uniref:polyprenyl synthetase family protein n=1 Tax=Streptomyces sp. NL15-2K TaxID=376149 RepID=UPI000F57EF38|nr:MULTISPECIES: polyprenyl synthetase family protein [Actinomycetes]WKX07383.1 polyprenyl synthetase family protein [Kutzneria buriramensis]GCB51382.1 octaprenyl diphosphate synthase [Streptomyces sp. NL15-2K]
MTSFSSSPAAQVPPQASRSAVDPAPFGAPHPSASAEAWYLIGHLRDEDGDVYSWMISILKHPDVRDRAAVPGYGLVCTHSGPAGVRHGAWISPTMLDAVRESVTGDAAMDPWVRTALSEALAEGPLLPERLLQNPVKELAYTLDITLGDLAALRQEENGDYRLSFRNGDQFDLLLTAAKPAVPQFDAQGRYPGRLPTEADAMTSHFLPRLHTRGTLLTKDGVRKQVTGDAWFEQDWGTSYYAVQRAPGTADHTWQWTGLQLDNGWEISCIHARNTDPLTGAATLEFARATAVAPDGSVAHHDLTWQPTRHWTSLATLNTYPTAVRVSVPALGLDVEVAAPTAGQEIRTLMVGRAFWESPATVRGTMGDMPVAGTAFVQTFPTNTIGDIENYMRRSHEIARAEAAAVYPADPADRTAVELLTGTGHGTDLDPTAHPRLHQAVVAPVLHLLDNPGRSWRPYISATVLCLLGVDPEPYRPLTALTELMHTSALIIDDIQDGSPTRRGAPSVHEVFGTAPTITAGTLGYYTFDPLIGRVPQPDPQTLLRIYRLYLRDLRAAHAGQALDLAGHHTAFDEAVETGDPRTLLAQIRTTHRLKTGMLVRSTAEIAAILANADDAQVRETGQYFENVGIAYQISDDVFDLYGQCSPDEYRRGLAVRTPAEDLRNGAVTYPVAHATGLLDKNDRLRLRTALHARTDAGAAEASDLLMHSGALDVCLTEARELVDHAWQHLDPLLPPTLHKAMVRALGWYAAQRVSEYDPHPPGPRTLITPPRW